VNQSLVMDVFIAPRLSAWPTASRIDGQVQKMNDDATNGERHSTESRLINWGRWCNAYKTSSGHCGSIEWMWQNRWKDANGWKDEPSAEKILAKIDTLDAERVQAIMQHLPLTYRVVLSLKYVKRENPKRIAYKANCREWQLDGLLFEILQTVSKCLTSKKG